MRATKVVKTEKCHQNVHCTCPGNTPAARHCRTAPHCLLTRTGFMYPYWLHVLVLASCTRTGPCTGSSPRTGPVLALVPVLASCTRSGLMYPFWPHVPVLGSPSALLTPRISLAEAELTICACPWCPGPRGGTCTNPDMRAVGRVVLGGYYTGYYPATHPVLGLVLPGPNQYQYTVTRVH